MFKYRVEQINTSCPDLIARWLNRNIDDELEVVISVSVDVREKTTTITIKDR